jgi:hypothetical protein
MVYCVSNPIKYLDPNGMWVAGFDENGNTIYQAEKDDNLETFMKQYDISKQQAADIFKSVGFSIMGSIEKGTNLTGSTVKKTMGTDILKGNWDNMTKQQQGNHLMFGILHSIVNDNVTENGSIDLSQYLVGMDASDYMGKYNGMLKNINSVPVVGGFIKADAIALFPPLSSSKPNSLIWNSITPYNTDMQRTDGSEFWSYRMFSSKNPNAKDYPKAITIAIPSAYQKIFEKNYYKK